MPAKRFPISDQAIAAAARFVRVGRRSYSKAGEPAHPSLRQVVAHLVGLGLVPKKPPPVTLGRALKRAGVVLPPHWRNKLASAVTCAAVSKVADTSGPGPRRPKALARPQALGHPWRRGPGWFGEISLDVNISSNDRSRDEVHQ